MNTTEFLEQAALDVSYSPRIKALLNTQSAGLQSAVSNHKSALVKDQYGDVGYLASPTNVVEFA